MKMSSEVANTVDKRTLFDALLHEDGSPVTSISYNFSGFSPDVPESARVGLCELSSIDRVPVSDWEEREIVFAIDVHHEAGGFSVTSLHSMGLMPEGKWAFLALLPSLSISECAAIAVLGARPLTAWDKERFEADGGTLAGEPCFAEGLLELPREGQLVYTCTGNGRREPVFSRYHGAFPGILEEHKEAVAWAMAERACSNFMASAFNISHQQWQAREKEHFLERLVPILSCGRESVPELPEGGDRWLRIARSPDCVLFDADKIPDWFAEARAVAHRIEDIVMLWRSAVLELSEGSHRQLFGNGTGIESGLMELAEFGEAASIEDCIRAWESGVPVSDIFPGWDD